MAIFARRRIKKIKKSKNKRKGKEFIPPVDIKEIKDATIPTPKLPIWDPNVPLGSPESLKEVQRKASPQSEPLAARPVAEPKDLGEVQETQQASFAPLFVKVSKYRQILNTLNSLKMTMNLIKNQLSILSELDKLRQDNLQLLHSAVDRVNDRLIKLDSEFMRPAGFMEEMPELQAEYVESLETTIEDLRGQIEGLKTEVEAVG